MILNQSHDFDFSSRGKVTRERERKRGGEGGERKKTVLVWVMSPPNRDLEIVPSCHEKRVADLGVTLGKE